MKALLVVMSALLLAHSAIAAQSKQEKLALAILTAKPLRVKAESGPTVTLSPEMAQRYVLAVVEVTKLGDRKREYLKALALRPGETHAEWAGRLGKDTAIVSVVKRQKMTPAEYVALGVTLHSAWEQGHRRKPVVPANPQALAWVTEHEEILKAMATVDGKHIPWPDGSLDGKGIKDRRFW